jgi:MFS family permease
VGSAPADVPPPRRSSFIGDLRTVLASGGFRKLYTTRLISQTGDGVFNAGLGAYVFFNAASFPDPAAAAQAFALLYLPYSLIGPFAGVFIDRWSRRQIMLWSALLRSGFAAITAVFIVAGARHLPIWLAALVVLGVNRFFLSSLSAALPHVVQDDELVMANSVSTTSGTIVAFIGGIIGIGVRLVTGPGPVSSAVILLAAGLFYFVAGLTATRMPRALLGPDLGTRGNLRSLVAELESVAAGLVTGLRHVWQRRPARAALTATAAHRGLYGILFLMSILLYRNYFYPGSHHSNVALQHFLPVVISSAFGYGAAAWLTPIATRRISTAAWITGVLAFGGVVTGVLGPSFGQVEFIGIGFGLGLTAQGLAICATTILQQEMEDEYRGRVFSVNDMLYNVAFVLGAALSAAFMPVSGRSLPMLLVVACGYVVAAALYRIMAGQSRPAGPLPSPGSPVEDWPVGSPDSRAQRSSS